LSLNLKNAKTDKEIVVFDGGVTKSCRTGVVCLVI